MGLDELDMKIEVKRLSRESRRLAEGEKEEKEKDREKRETDRQTTRQTSSPEEKAGSKKQKKLIFRGHPRIVCIADPPKPGKRGTRAQE